MVWIWLQYGLHMACIWLEYGLHMVWTWFEYGLNMAGIWFEYALNKAWTWLEHGLHMARIWLEYGLDWGPWMDFPESFHRSEIAISVKQWKAFSYKLRYTSKASYRLKGTHRLSQKHLCKKKLKREVADSQILSSEQRSPDRGFARVYIYNKYVLI